MMTMSEYRRGLLTGLLIALVFLQLGLIAGFREAKSGKAPRRLTTRTSEGLQSGGDAAPTDRMMLLSTLGGAGHGR